MNIWLFMLSCILTNNFIFSKFLGCCPFLGVSSKVETAASMGVAVTFVMTIASLFAYMVNTWVLVPLNLEYMQTIAFILIIAGLVQFVEMFMKKSMPARLVCGATSGCSSTLGLDLDFSWTFLGCFGRFSGFAG